MAFTARPTRHRKKSSSSDEQWPTTDKCPAVSFSYKEIFFLGLESQSNVYCCTKLRKSLTDDDDEKLLVGSLRGTVFCIDYKDASMNSDYRPIANKVYFTYIPGKEMKNVSIRSYQVEDVFTKDVFEDIFKRHRRYLQVSVHRCANETTSPAMVEIDVVNGKILKH